MKNEITIDTNTANRIALASMKDWRKYLIKENKDLKKKFPLPDHLAHDYNMNTQYIQALDLIISAYEPV
jgi:hypothetical protein